MDQDEGCKKNIVRAKMSVKRRENGRRGLRWRYMNDCNINDEYDPGHEMKEASEFWHTNEKTTISGWNRYERGVWRMRKGSCFINGFSRFVLFVGCKLSILCSCSCRSFDRPIHFHKTKCVFFPSIVSTLRRDTGINNL